MWRLRVAVVVPGIEQVVRSLHPLHGIPTRRQVRQWEYIGELIHPARQHSTYSTQHFDNTFDKQTPKEVHAALGLMLVGALPSPVSEMATLMSGMIGVTASVTACQVSYISLHHHGGPSQGAEADTHKVGDVVPSIDAHRLIHWLQGERRRMLFDGLPRYQSLRSGHHVSITLQHSSLRVTRPVSDKWVVHLCHEHPIPHEGIPAGAFVDHIFHVLLSDGCVPGGSRVPTIDGQAAFIQ